MEARAGSLWKMGLEQKANGEKGTRMRKEEVGEHLAKG